MKGMAIKSPTNVASLGKKGGTKGAPKLSGKRGKKMGRY